MSRSHRHCRDNRSGIDVARSGLTPAPRLFSRARALLIVQPLPAKGRPLVRGSVIRSRPMRDVQTFAYAESPVCGFDVSSLAFPNPSSQRCPGAGRNARSTADVVVAGAARSVGEPAERPDGRPAQRHGLRPQHPRDQRRSDAACSARCSAAWSSAVIRRRHSSGGLKCATLRREQIQHPGGRVGAQKHRVNSIPRPIQTRK